MVAGGAGAVWAGLRVEAREVEAVEVEAVEVEDTIQEAREVNILTAVRPSVDEDQPSPGSLEAAQVGVMEGWSSRWDSLSGQSQTAARG